MTNFNFKLSLILGIMEDLEADALSKAGLQLDTGTWHVQETKEDQSSE